MLKTWPYIQKNQTCEFFASERRTERRERVQALGRHLLLELFDCDADAINSLEAVKTAMVEAVPELKDHVHRSQIAFKPASDWYMRGGTFES